MKSSLALSVKRIIALFQVSLISTKNYLSRCRGCARIVDMRVDFMHAVQIRHGKTSARAIMRFMRIAQLTLTTQKEDVKIHLKPAFLQVKMYYIVNAATKVKSYKEQREAAFVTSLTESDSVWLVDAVSSV